MLKLATLFSGIGAIEQALKQLDIEYEIKFACDNGERELGISKEEIESNIKKNNIKNIKYYIDDLYSKTGITLVAFKSINRKASKIVCSSNK